MNVRKVENVTPLGECTVWSDDPRGVFERHWNPTEGGYWWTFTSATAALKAPVTDAERIVELERIYRYELDTIANLERSFALPAAKGHP